MVEEEDVKAVFGRPVSCCLLGNEMIDLLGQLLWCNEPCLCFGAVGDPGADLLQGCLCAGALPHLKELSCHAQAGYKHAPAFDDPSMPKIRRDGVGVGPDYRSRVFHQLPCLFPCL